MDRDLGLHGPYPAVLTSPPSCTSLAANLASIGLQPDTQAATALVKACCKDMELAQSMFEELFGECFGPGLC